MNGILFWLVLKNDSDYCLNYLAEFLTKNNLVTQVCQDNHIITNRLLKIITEILKVSMHVWNDSQNGEPKVLILSR